MAFALKKRSVVPGFGLTMGFTLLYLGLLVLIPLSMMFLRATSLSWEEFWRIVTSPRVVASYRLSFGASLAAAAINAGFGSLVAWVLVRYSFPGRRLVDGLIDLPFALPTAVGGLALTATYSSNGWIGQHLASAGIRSAYTPLGVVIALTFIGLPFVVRTVQPVLADLDAELEEALEVADRVAVINEGQVVQVGTPEEVYHSPASPFVYNFLGKVNLFHGRIEDGRVSIGNLSMTLPQDAASGATHAKVYVRPQHFHLHRSPSGNRHFRARVLHINPTGSMVKAGVLTDWGDHALVELAEERYRHLDLSEGADVYVTLDEERVLIDVGGDESVGCAD